MIVSRIFKAASVASVLLGVGITFAVPATAQAATKANVSSAHSEDTLLVEFGPYPSEISCDIYRAVELNDEGAAGATECGPDSSAGPGWFFIAWWNNV